MPAKRSEPSQRAGPSAPPPWRFSRRKQLGTFALIVLLLSAVALRAAALAGDDHGRLRAFLAAWGDRPLDLPADHSIGLNTAGTSELMRLPGVGPSLARAIQHCRCGKGGYGRSEELLHVPGISTATFAKLARYLVEVPAPFPDSTCNPFGTPPDLNAIDANKLRASCVLSPPTLRALLGRRNAGGFRSWAAVATVPGIGAAELERLQAVFHLTAPPKINLNTATQAGLERLPGIGPVTARSILADRRQHGVYRQLDDLRRVSGIGPKTVEKLRPLVELD